MPRRFFNFLVRFLLDLIFPWQCLYCRQEPKNDYPLCESCFRQIPIFDDFICPICQKRLGNNLQHRSCKNKTHLSGLGAVTSYNNLILKEAIHFFKYKQIKNLVFPLSLLMIQFLENSFYFSQLIKNKPLVIPLPLHPRKQKQRGFNQSELLAEKICQKFHLPLENRVLYRQINNPAQAFINDLSKRRQNVADIFSVKNKQRLKNQWVILIDDVYATGSTIEEAARILKLNGAKKIIGLVLARG